MRIERILVPTDFSEYSQAALRYAIELAREHESEVVLAHVVEPLPYGVSHWYDPAELLERYGEAASADLGRLEKEAIQLYPKCRAELHFGTVREVIDKLVSNLKVDLIVISMQGRNGLHYFLPGGTAEKILHYAKCPVLRIRTPA